MLRIITALQLYLLGHYFMTLPLVRMECRLGKREMELADPLARGPQIWIS